MIDKEEFKKVMTWMRAQTRQGAAHTNGLRTGLKVAGDVENGGVVEFFFGKDGKRELPHEEFEKFLRELHEEVFCTVSFLVALHYSNYNFNLNLNLLVLPIL